MYQDNLKPVIFGLEGPSISPAETDFFKSVRPLGYILFKRNIVDAAQVKKLCQDLRALDPESLVHILIDQEGGRVARLSSPPWPKFPPGKVFGDTYVEDKNAAKQEAWDNYAAIARELTALGVDVDCLPLLDVPIEGAHDVIGDRAFARDIGTVAALGHIAAESMLASGVMPIMKHIPGHGRAMVDSHLSLPVVNEDLATLQRTDFIPFKQCADIPWAMTAHVCYTALDEKEPATFSKKIVGEVIRDFIGFKGVLLSDDIGMKALSGSFADRARKSLEAGCDIVLHCSGVMSEMQDTAKGLPPRIAESTIDRLLAGEKRRAKINQKIVQAM